MSPTFRTSLRLFPLLLALCLLQACGAERDTPFNASVLSSASSSSSSLSTAITGVENLLDNTERDAPAMTDNQSKQLIAIRDEAQMAYYWDAYIQDTDWDTDVVDFETGQVLLVDLGELGNCTKFIDVQNVKLYDYSANTAKVIIRYTDTGKSSSSSSSSLSSSDLSSSSSSSSSSSYSEPSCEVDAANPNHPFRFYYIPTRKTLVFQEDVE